MLITATANGETQVYEAISKSSLSGWAFWVPYEDNAISYEWAHANNWAVPGGIAKPTAVGSGFRDEELSEEVWNGGHSFSSYQEEPLLPPNLAEKVGEAVQSFKESNLYRKDLWLRETFSEIIGEKHEDNWYSYAGIYLLYGTYITRYVKTTNRNYPVRLSKAPCKNREELSENVVILDDGCGSPLPDWDPSRWKGGGGGGGGGRGGSRRRKIKKSPAIWSQQMCCRCEIIADLLDRQTEQVKQLLESQNKEIGAGLTAQTEFLKEQMVALAPKGFDYKPIWSGQRDVVHDVINALWNGVPFNLE